ncbi:DUF3592 domain-containing protein [Lentisphaerae bacterium WC36]|nr:DUF3592 domain-containing protein [Lentisphaerae bacterium WC36]
MAETQFWTHTKCEVLTSKIKENISGNTTTYASEIIFKYYIKDQDYTSNTFNCYYNFYTSNYKQIAKIVHKYPVGTKTICYVNPKDPFEAVISREKNDNIFMFIFLSITLFIGIGLLIAKIFKII